MQSKENIEAYLEDEIDYTPKSAWKRAWKIFKNIFRTPPAKIGGVIFAIIIILAIIAPLIAPYGPYDMDLRAKFAKPSLTHLCGTDSYGRDIFSRLLYGAKYSLVLALFADIIGHSAGVILGSIAGYFGGKVENLIMRFCDIWQAIPGTLMTIIIAAAFGAGFFNTILALSIGGIPGGQE